MPPSLISLTWWSVLAALSAAFGPVLAVPRRWLPFSPLGWASALAAGMMLGVAYPLMVVGVERAANLAAIGALLGVAAPYLAHVLIGVGSDDGPTSDRGMTLTGAVHGASEGIAMGAAMTLGAPLGFFLVATLAVHNVWESAVLADRLESRGSSGRRAALLGVITNVPQAAMAVASHAILLQRPALLPVLLGVAFGALVYLCFAELLPDSYRREGRTSIALVVSVAAGVVAVMAGRT